MKVLINNPITKAMLFTLCVSMPLYAANDPSIKGDLRSNIQKSMNNYINNNTINGHMYLYDSVKGKLLKLKLDELHEGIVEKSGFYVSCADFKDQNGRKVDIDFLVRPASSQLITTQGIVHSINGKKRKYHLENI